jgi:Gas vesicle synthesis protein GvpL/GvpF
VILVYALVGAGQFLQGATGVARQRLRVVRAGGVGAVIGELSRRPVPSTRNLRRYAAVVESIAARVPAILPARFGTTFEDGSELSFVLRVRSTSIRRRLRAVRGRVQMTIRMVFESESGDGSRASQTRVTGRARLRLEHESTQGTQYLQRRMEQARQMRKIPELAPIRPRTKRFVKDERVERRAGIVTVHHLVPKSQTSRYRTTVERLADANGLRLTVSGPWAPYAFADHW